MRRCKADHVQAVGLDVLPEEPANPDHPLIKAWAADEEWIDHRLLITPHSAFYTPESVHDMRFKGGEVIVKYLGTGGLDNCVNQAMADQPALADPCKADRGSACIREPRHHDQ